MQAYPKHILWVSNQIQSIPIDHGGFDRPSLMLSSDSHHGHFDSSFNDFDLHFYSIPESIQPMLSDSNPFSQLELDFSPSTATLNGSKCYSSNPYVRK